jgi:hypothetical protein
MTIKFVCSCGKHLRAGDDLANRRTVCPACGAMVGVPALGPAQPGALTGPMSPEEIDERNRVEATAAAANPFDDVGPIYVRLRRRQHDPNSAVESKWIPLDPDVEKPPALEAKPRPKPRKPRRRAGGRLEKSWYECLIYPFRAGPLLIGLGLSQAIVIAWASMMVPRLFEPPAGPLEDRIGSILSFTAAVCGVFAYTAASLDCVLVGGATGEYRGVPWPGYDLDLILRSVIAWVACYLAGPVLPAVAALRYWLSWGDPVLLDWVILGELGVLAVGYFLLLRVALSEGGILSFTPFGVGSMLRRLGPRALVASAAATALLVGHGQFLVAGLANLHREPPAGFFLLVVVCTSGTFAALFFFRLFGIWLFHTRPPEPVVPDEASEQSPLVDPS